MLPLLGPPALLRSVANASGGCAVCPIVLKSLPTPSLSGSAETSAGFSHVWIHDSPNFKFSSDIRLQHIWVWIAVLRAFSLSYFWVVPPRCVDPLGSARSRERWTHFSAILHFLLFPLSSYVSLCTLPYTILRGWPSWLSLTYSQLKHVLTMCLLRLPI